MTTSIFKHLPEYSSHSKQQVLHPNVNPYRFFIVNNCFLIHCLYNLNYDTPTTTVIGITARTSSLTIIIIIIIIIIININIIIIIIIVIITITIVIHEGSGVNKLYNAEVLAGGFGVL